MKETPAIACMFLDRENGQSAEPLELTLRPLRRAGVIERTVKHKGLQEK